MNALVAQNAGILRQFAAPGTAVIAAAAGDHQFVVTDYMLPAPLAGLDAL